MADCPIFNALDATEAIWTEIDRLTASVPQAFDPEAIQVGAPIEDHATDNPYTQYGYHYEVRNRSWRRRAAQQFLLMFDLRRLAAASTWPHARTALLTFAYCPDYNHGWKAAEVAINSAGQPAHDETCETCDLDPSGRLVRWIYTDGPCRQQHWFFSIPLVEIRDHNAFTHEVVRPVSQLLGDATPVSALEGTHAVKFSSWRASVLDQK